MRRPFLGLAGVLSLMLPACGGGGGGPTSTPTTTVPPAPTTTNIFNRPFSVTGAPSGGVAFGFQDIAVPNSGTVDVTFDWTFATTDIDLVVTPTTCPDGISAYNSLCTTLGSDKAGPTTTRRARVSFQQSAAGNIRVWVYNFATAQESGVLNANLTR